MSRACVYLWVFSLSHTFLSQTHSCRKIDFYCDDGKNCVRVRGKRGSSVNGHHSRLFFWPCTNGKNEKRVIESIFVGTNQFVSNNPNGILTWQTCVLRSSMAAGSKRQESVTHFCMRIWYMFLMSKGRGERDQGLCTFPVLAKRMWLHSADFRSNPGRKFV